MYCTGFCFYIILYMETAENYKVYYQYFVEDALKSAIAFEMLTLAYICGEHCGPVIMVCSEKGYDYLVNYALDELYIDIIICPEKEDVERVVANIELHATPDQAEFINSLQTSPENLRNLYNINSIDEDVLKHINASIEKEETKFRI